jgi:hypothetical protein
MIRTSTAWAAVLLLVCIACNQTNRNAKDIELSKESIVIQDTAVDSTLLPHQEPTQGSEKEKDKIAQKAQIINWDKKIIKTAKLNAEVKNYKNFSAQINDRVKKYGGYVSQEEQSQTEYKIENAIVIKVPVDQFESAVNDLLKDADKINEKTISSDDVTAQFVDGKSRLEAKRQIRLRYLDLLKQARNMEEILAVQKEINDIHEEIESLTGRLNFLGHSAAMSTINFSFYQVLDASANGPKDVNFLTKVKTSFTNGLYWMGEVLIGFVGLWPLILLLVTGIYLFRKKRVIKI